MQGGIRSVGRLEEVCHVVYGFYGGFTVPFEKKWYAVRGTGEFGPFDEVYSDMLGPRI